MTMRFRCDTDETDQEDVTYKDFTFDIVISAGCLSTWNLPTADSYNDSEFIIDIATSSSLTITWTADTNTRNCEYDSSISIIDDTATAYNSFTVVHNKETFSTSGTSTVSADATTALTAQLSDIGSYTVTYTMADISNSNIE